MPALLAGPLGRFLIDRPASSSVTFEQVSRRQFVTSMGGLSDIRPFMLFL